MIQSVAMQKKNLFCISYVIMWHFLYCTYDCNPRDVLYCKYTNHKSVQVPLNLIGALREEGGVLSANAQYEVKYQRVYKASFLLPAAQKRDISLRGGALTMRTSVVLLVLLAVASHTAASK